MFDDIIKKMKTSYEWKNNKEIQSYIKTLNDDDKIVFTIAYEHLQSSFDVMKSVGFIQYINNCK